MRMIELVVAKGVFDREYDQHRIEWAGQTPRELVGQWGPQWENARVFVNGADRGDELDRPLAPGAQVLIGPALGEDAGEVLLNVALQVLVSIAVSYIWSLIFPVEFPSINRDDDESGSFGYSGMQTDYLPLGPIPKVYGEIDCPGTVVSTYVGPLPLNFGRGTAEFLQMVLILGHGRMESIGGVTGIEGNVDGLGRPGSGALLPPNIRLNGNVVDESAQTPTLELSFRLGTPGQPALPAEFDGTRTFFDVRESLLDMGDVGTLEVAFAVTDVSCRLDFNQGLFVIDQNGTAIAVGSPISFTAEWREFDVAGKPWNHGATVAVSSQSGNVRDPFAINITFRLPDTVATPWQVRLTRNTIRGSVAQQDQAIFTGVNVLQPLRLNYSNLATLGLLFELNEKLKGGRQNLRIRTQGTRLAFWRESGDPVSINTITSADPAEVAFAAAHPYPDVYWLNRQVYVDIAGVTGSAPDDLNGDRQLVTIKNSTTLIVQKDTSTTSGSGGTVTFRNEWAPRTTWQPETLEPFDFHAHAVGKNPAWVLLDWLTDDAGLGEFFKDRELRLDLGSFRQWASYCDQEIDDGNGNGVPRFRFDGTFDRFQSAWKYALAILRAGAASVVQRGRKIVVKYSYRDAHGSEDPALQLLGATLDTTDPLYVPPRATYNGTAWETNHTQVFCASNLNNYVCKVLNNVERPTVIDAQILNEDIGYELDPISVPDDKALGFNAAPNTVLNAVGVIRDSRLLVGVTRPVQARYLSKFELNVSRLARTTISFDADVDSLVCEPGDLIVVHSDAIKPRTQQRADSTWQEGFGLMIADDHVGLQSTIKVDTELTIPKDEDWHAFFLDIFGTAVVHVWIPQDASDRTFLAGDAIPLHDPTPPHTASTALFATESRPIAIGPVNRTAVTYEIGAIETREDMVSSVSAIEWHPEYYDIDLSTGAPVEEEDDPPAILIPNVLRSIDLAPKQTVPAVEGLRVEPSEVPGVVRVSWSPVAKHRNRSTRVYLDRGDGWQLIGETRSNSLETQAIRPGETISVAVAPADDLETPASVAEATQTTVVVDEFPRGTPPRLLSFRADTVGEGILFSWSPWDSPDLEFYEVREGATLFESKIVGRTTDDRFLYLAPNMDATTFTLRAKSKRSGLYSHIASSVSASYGLPPGMTAQGSTPVDDLVTAPDGTLSGVEYDATLDEVRLINNHGTYTMDAVDLTTTAVRWWAVQVGYRAIQFATIADMNFSPYSGEASWWTMGGREPTAAKRGYDFDLKLDDIAVLSDLDDVTPNGPRGAIGRHTRVLTEVRYHDGSSWGPYALYNGPEQRDAQQIQVRLTLDRRSDTYQIYVGTLKVTAGA